MLGRLLACLLLATALTACTDEADSSPSSRTSLSPDAVAEPGDGGALDALDGSLLLEEADDDSYVDDLLVGSDGEPVVLASPTGEHDRQLLRPTATDGWTALRESDLGTHVQLGRLVSAGPEGVLAAGVEAGVLTLYRIAPDASVDAVPVTGAPAGLAHGAGFLAPDGGTLYLVFGADGGPTTVAEADPATGEIRASTEAPPDTLVGFAGTDLVFLDTGTEGEDRSEITRLTAELAPAGTVAVGESYLQATGGPDGTVHAAALVRDPEDSTVEVSLLRAGPGATEPETVWSVSGVELLAELRAPVVDPDGAWAYLPTQQLGVGDLVSLERLTPVDLATGEPGGSVTLCPGYHFGGMAFAPDGDGAVAAVRCRDSEVPTLIRLR